PPARRDGRNLPETRKAATRRVILRSAASDHDQGSIGVSLSSPKVSADAPGPDRTASRLADGAARGVPAAVHRAVVPHVLRPGRGVPGADGPADGVRHADRRGPVPGVEPPPGAPVLLAR